MRVKHIIKNIFVRVVRIIKLNQDLDISKERRTMEFSDKDKEKLHIIYMCDEPIMKMESSGVQMTFHFAKEPPANNAKQAVIDALTSSYIKR